MIVAVPESEYQQDNRSSAGIIRRSRQMPIEQNLAESIAAHEPEAIVADVAIVGGGLAGSLAAAVLARAGYRIILIDRRAVHPDEFRVEKIAGQQLDILRRLGFVREREAVASPYDRVTTIRAGNVVDV